MKQSPKKTGASLARGKSRQDYSTPKDFMRAVINRFGLLSFDLAADSSNKKHPNFFSPKDDSLKQKWHEIRGLLWLNPPFDPIQPWVEKCAHEASLGAKILLLAPASVGSNWFRDFVYNKSLVLVLNGRLTFVGETDPYPRDCFLACYGWTPGFEIWNWKPAPPPQIVLR